MPATLAAAALALLAVAVALPDPSPPPPPPPPVYRVALHVDASRTLADLPAFWSSTGFRYESRTSRTERRNGASKRLGICPCSLRRRRCFRFSLSSTPFLSTSPVGLLAAPPGPGGPSRHELSHGAPCCSSAPSAAAAETYLLSKEMEWNLAYIGAMPRRAVRQVRAHWLLQLVRAVRAVRAKPR